MPKTTVTTSCWVSLFDSIYEYSRLVKGADVDVEKVQRAHARSWDVFARFMCDTVFAADHKLTTSTGDELKRLKLAQPSSVFSTPGKDGVARAVVLDYDTITHYDYERVLRAVATSPYECLLHTTSTHADATPKVHIVFPFAQPVPVIELKHCVIEIVESLGFPHVFDKSVFVPGASIFVPFIRIESGFCEWHAHAPSGSPLPQFKLLRSMLASEDMLRKYSKSLGSIASLGDILSTPALRTEQLLETKESTRRLVDLPDKLSARSIASPVQVGNYRHALHVTASALSASVGSSLKKHRLVKILESVSKLADAPSGIVVRDAPTPSHMFVSLRSPCPVCKEARRRTQAFGSLHIGTGSVRLRCSSKSCGFSWSASTKNQITRDTARIIWNVFMRDSLRFVPVSVENSNMKLVKVAVADTHVYLTVASILAKLAIDSESRLALLLESPSASSVDVGLPAVSDVVSSMYTRDSGVPFISTLRKHSLPMGHSGMRNIYVVKTAKSAYEKTAHTLCEKLCYPALCRSLATVKVTGRRTLKHIDLTSRKGNKVPNAVLPPDLLNLLDDAWLRMVPPHLLVKQARGWPPFVILKVTDATLKAKDTKGMRLTQKIHMFAMRGVRVILIPCCSADGTTRSYAHPAFRICAELNLNAKCVTPLASLLRTVPLMTPLLTNAFRSAERDFEAQLAKVIGNKQSLNGESGSCVTKPTKAVTVANTKRGLAKAQSAEQEQPIPWHLLDFPDSEKED